MTKTFIQVFQIILVTIALAQLAACSKSRAAAEARVQAPVIGQKFVGSWYVTAGAMQVECENGTGEPTELTVGSELRFVGSASGIALVDAAKGATQYDFVNETLVAKPGQAFRGTIQNYPSVSTVHSSVVTLSVDGRSIRFQDMGRLEITTESKVITCAYSGWGAADRRR